MRAARMDGYGAPPRLVDVQVPTPGHGEALVRVHAAALNPLDLKLQTGAMDAFFPLSFPYTLGTDFAGVVERVGPGTHRFKAGDRVVGRVDPTRGGAFADFVAIEDGQLAAVPSGISWVDAAGVPTAGGTAWQALFEAAHLTAEQTLLVHGGAGGVGSFAIQLGRATGARVVTTATGAGVEIARDLGAHQVIDYANDSFTASLSQVDVVLDTVGGDTQRRSFDVLRRSGVLVSTTSPPDEARARDLGVSAMFVLHSSDGPRLGKLMERLDARSLRVLVDRALPLSEVDRALARQASGEAQGKIVLLLG